MHKILLTDEQWKMFMNDASGEESSICPSDWALEDISTCAANMDYSDCRKCWQQAIEKNNKELEKHE